MKVTLIIGFLFYTVGAPAFDGWRPGLIDTVAPEVHQDINRSAVGIATTVRHLMAEGQHYLIASL